MSKFYVVGIGPGNPDYLLPAGLKIIETSDVIIGGKRNLESFEHLGKEHVYITAKLDEISNYITANLENKRISVIVSGDSGFYSMLGFISRNFENSQFEVIPGISSLQYMFSRLNMMWHDALLTSVHGRDQKLSDMMENYDVLGLLTDKINTPRKIAQEVLESGHLNSTLFVGENLSYSNERITRFSAMDLSTYDGEFETLNVVIVVKG